MPYYAGLKNIEDKNVAKRTVTGLQALRAGLAAQIPAKTTSDTLLIGTWNIREFDSGKYGNRTEEEYYYIAEIVSRFDIIAIQEVRGVYSLQRLLKLLGSWWGMLVTDVTLGASGFSERMAFLFDKRKVSSTGLAAEVVLPSSKKAQILQFARTPYVAGFRAGWANFSLATVHIYYGKGINNDPRRLQEIKNLCETLAKNANNFSSAPQYEQGRILENNNLLILGDFNIFGREDETMEAIIKAKFIVPPELWSLPKGTNMSRNKFYDQIAYYKRMYRMQATGQAGVFNFYDHVFNDERTYAAVRGGKGRSFKDWRTYRMSDHLPMWIEFRIDDTDQYLAELASKL